MSESGIKQRIVISLGTSLLSLVLLVSIPLHALAEEVDVFGPQVFEKGKGRPVTYSESFSAVPGLTDFRFLVTNGAAGAGEVKNVSISLNGVEIVSSSDLKASGSTQQLLSFPIQGENLLEVTLKGQGGNAVSVHLTAMAPEPLPEEEIPLPPMSQPEEGVLLGSLAL